MPPGSDDTTINSDNCVYRVLHDRWVTTKGGRTRPTTDSLTDSNFENSCFVGGEISLEELHRLYPGKKVARIPVSVMRGQGYWLERRPDEAPEGCTVPTSHVVCGPSDSPVRGVYEAKARQIVKSELIIIVEPR